MTNLVITDLDRSAELDREALQTVCGGEFPGFTSWDQLMANIDNGNLGSNIDLTTTGNILSPTIVTSLALYMPINTIVQLDLDNIIATETIVASNL